MHLLGFDNLYQPVSTDMSVLRHYSCRTAKMIDNGDEAMSVAEDGTPMFRSWMTRSMLICFMKSLTLGKLCTSADVSYSDARDMFDFEGICVPSSDDIAEYNAYALKNGIDVMGIGLNKRAETLMETTERISDAIAMALCEWPRLEHGLESQFSGDDATDQTVGFSCTPTRCWIRLLGPLAKIIPHTPDPIYSVCKNRPFWLASTLYLVGVIHQRLVTLKKIVADDRSEAAFFALEAGINQDPLQHFASTRCDVPKAWRDRAIRSLGAAERFAVSTLNEVTERGPLKEGDKISNTCKFSRATVSLAIKLVSSTPRISKMFAGGCEDREGATPERAALAKALKKYKIKVVRWGEEPKALCFPPSFRSQGLAEGPCVLLGFENVR